MWIVLIVLGTVIGVFVVFVVVPSLVMRAIKAPLQKRIAARYPADAIVLEHVGALSLGLTSKGVLQGRGNGALVLTPTTLHWFQFVPAWDLPIPRDQITAVTIARSHLGKRIGRDLLHVTFTRDGVTDSMAWYVTDLQRWLDELSPASSAFRAAPPAGSKTQPRGDED